MKKLQPQIPPEQIWLIVYDLNSAVKAFEEVQKLISEFDRLNTFPKDMDTV